MFICSNACLEYQFMSKKNVVNKLLTVISQMWTGW